MVDCQLLCLHMRRQIFTTATLFCLSILTSVTALSQKLTKDITDQKLNGLTDKEQVDYIIKNFYAIYSADFDNALLLTKRATEIAHKNNWKDEEGHALMFQGIVYFLKGNYDNSLPQFLSAYTLFDSLKNEEALIRLNSEMGVFYRRQSDTLKAYEHLERAILLSKKLNNRGGLATALSHIAVLKQGEGKIDEAFSSYQEVYKIRIEQKDSVGLGYALLDLSTIELEKGNIKKALDYIEQSTKIREKLGDDQGMAINLVNTGETYFSIKDYRNAVLYFDKSLKKSYEVGYTDLIRYNYDQLAMTHGLLKDYRSAYEYQQKNQLFKDSLYNIEKAKVISDLEIKYETEKKKQQITLQQAQLSEQQAHINFNYTIISALAITLILVVIIFLLLRNRLKRERELSVREALINATLSSQETERKRFAQDLHDGMGQLISSLQLTIKSLDTQTTSEKRLETVHKSENIMNEMHREIRSIAFNLMPQTLILSGLVPAIKEMATRINETGKISVGITSFDMPERLAEVSEISVYRVVQEWINNIMKYSGATTVTVNLVAHEKEISVMIEDNGNGFDMATLEKSQGNGWRNIQSRVKLIRGSLNIDSQPSRKGSTLSIEFPLIAREIVINEAIV